MCFPRCPLKEIPQWASPLLRWATGTSGQKASLLKQESELNKFVTMREVLVLIPFCPGFQNFLTSVSSQTYGKITHNFTTVYSQPALWGSKWHMAAVCARCGEAPRITTRQSSRARCAHSHLTALQFSDLITPARQNS